jgi:hypothetical protein
LHKVFGYFSLFHQKKCRLVCKAWEEETRTYIRKGCKVNLSRFANYFASRSKDTICGCNDYICSCKGHYVDHECEEHTTLLGLGRICNSFVIEEITPAIRSFLFCENILVKYLELRNLIWDVATVESLLLKKLHDLEELRLPIQCSVPSTNGTLETTTATSYKKRILTNNQKITGSEDKSFIDTYPKLRVIIVTLTIKDLQFYHQENTSVTPLLQLLKKSPNLEEIYYPNVVQFTSPFDNPARILFEGITSTFPGGCRLSRLSTLKIDTYVTNQDLLTLAAQAFPLKNVQITLTPSVACKYLYHFLESLEQSLESLVLTFRDGFRLTSPFPYIPSLQKMAIILWNGYFEYIQDIKQLKTLIVVLVEMDVERIERKQILEFSQKTKIQDLDIHGARAARQSDSVQRLINLSPTSSLRRLTIDYVTDVQLQTIYQTLSSSLEELLILYGGFTPTGITGIPENFCLDEHCDKEFFAKGLKRHRGIEDLKRKANICFLS